MQKKDIQKTFTIYEDGEPYRQCYADNLDSPYELKDLVKDRVSIIARMNELLRK